jgi:hypothetical protein
VDIRIVEMEKAEHITQLKQLRDSGNISESEYIELVEDILDLEKIQADITYEKQKIQAQKLIDNLKVVAGLL